MVTKYVILDEILLEIICDEKGDKLNILEPSSFVAVINIV